MHKSKITMLQGAHVEILVVILHFFTLNMVQSSRENVVITGTTVGPAYERPTERKSSDCPESHPFTIDNFKSCCSQKNRDPSKCPEGASGYLQEKDPVSCCQGSDYVACSDPPCKSHSKAFEIEGSWGEWGGFMYCADCPSGFNVQRYRLCFPLNNPRTVCTGGLDTEYDYHCLGDEACCTPSNLCSAGYGDCQSHNDCEAGLRCGESNCVGESFDSDDDCCSEPLEGSWGGWGSWTRCSDCASGMNDKRVRTCEPSGDPLTVCTTGSSIEEVFHCFGGDSCCHPGNLCGEGHGDCDNDSDCESGLVCGNSNCSGEGFETPQNSGSPDDCCYRPS